MLTLLTTPPRTRGYLLSAGLRAAALLGLFSLVRLHPLRLAANQLPGTLLGTATLVYYSPGAPPRASAARPAVSKPADMTAQSEAMTAPQRQAEPADLSATNGTGDSSESGLGEGDLRIALPSYFPTPAPSLATMPAGTAGDVILDAVIDERGHILQLTVVKGLTPAINQQVIATVQQWTYTPAMRGGTPVASGQELHFHFERGDAG